jgi:hypothetical protein
VILLSLDPSSTTTGYAVFKDGKFIEAGKLKPARAADPANDRIRVMTWQLRDLANSVKPTHIVIEDTSGKVGRRHGGGGSGLAIHGKAVGWFISVAEHIIKSENVRCITENTWTRSIKKATRQERVAAMIRNYDPEKDKGVDVADAIGLGLYYLEVLRMESVRTSETGRRHRESAAVP